MEKKRLDPKILRKGEREIGGKRTEREWNKGEREGERRANSSRS